jgi:3-hydroxyisobutyrate dehydrogenase
MGGPMARNLVAAGTQLRVYNRDPAKLEPLTGTGAVAADSPAAAARGADVICTCVSNPEALRSVMTGEGGAISGAKTGALFIDFSTVDPATSREMSAACDAARCSFIEAPVSGGVGGAQGGTLTVIVGGEQADYDRALPILNIVGKQISLVGPVGTGSAIKLINQMLVGINLAGVLEAFVLGQRAGIATELLYDTVRQSSGASGMLNRAVPGNLMPRKFDPGFSLSLLQKDLRLVSAMAEELGMELPVATAVQAIYEEGARSGLGDRDMTAAVLPMEERYGIEAGTSEGQHGDQ